MWFHLAPLTPFFLLIEVRSRFGLSWVLCTSYQDFNYHVIKQVLMVLKKSLLQSVRCVILAQKLWLNIALLRGLATLSTIEGFHVTSYQANFASHLTRDRHVSFLSPHSGIGKKNQMSQNPFYLVYITVPNYNWVTRILAHTLSCTKGTQEAWRTCARISTYLVVQTLYCQSLHAASLLLF